MILSCVDYTPPFKITPFILHRCQAIAKELGALSGAKLEAPPVKLRRINNIKTIQASLAIEGNTLTLDQVTQVFEGKRVIGPKKDILEAQNAIRLYQDLGAFDPLSIDGLLKAHGILMQGLVDQVGTWRMGGVGLLKGNQIAHVAPPAKHVPTLMDNLFKFLIKDKEMLWLIKACIFHYELEFIHPFADGNGRMGRLWQQLILMKEDRIFEFIPIEVLIKENQQGYCRVLGECDQLGDSTLFIEFSLELILLSLKDYNQSTLTTVADSPSRLGYAQSKMGSTWFSRKDYIALHKNISSSTASRDLLQGVTDGILRKKGENNQARYSFDDPDR